MNKSFGFTGCLLAAAASALLCCTSCQINGVRIVGYGARTSRTAQVPSFSSVDISVPVTAVINVMPGATPSVHLNGYENLLNCITVKVENDRLKIYSDRSWNISLSGNDTLSAVITLPAITALSLEGSPDAYIHGTVTGDKFEVEVSGSSDVYIDSLNTKDFTSTISGSGDLSIRSGAVQHASYEISGSGDIRAFPLQSQETVATILGSGDAEITAATSLNMSVAGSGDIRYKGHPTIRQNVSGSGDIEDAN